MQVQLILANEHHRGRVIPVNVPSFMIGRSEGCNLRSRSPNVSRYHCTIQIVDGMVIVQDLGGENGTFVNGKRVATVQPLKHGDKLTVGAHAFVVSITMETGRSEVKQEDAFFELTAASGDPAPAAPPKSEESGTHPVDSGMATVVMQPNNPVQESEMMFELRLNGQRVSVTKSRLFDLAQKGSVSPDDLITVAGTKVFADSIQGIVFGDRSAPPPPPPATPPPVAASPSATPAAPQQRISPAQASPVSAQTAAAPGSDSFDFSGFGDVSDTSQLFDDIAATGPAVRVARKESAFGAIWKALDISFSRVYTMEGNNLVIHTLKALYYILVVSCSLVVLFYLIGFCTAWHESKAFLQELNKQYVGLAAVTFGSVAIIVIVRVLLEMLLLAWLESARQEEEERKGKRK